MVSTDLKERLLVWLQRHVDDDPMLADQYLGVVLLKLAEEGGDDQMERILRGVANRAKR